MSCRSTKGRYLENKTRCVITLITEYLTWRVKDKGKRKRKDHFKTEMAGTGDSRWAEGPSEPRTVVVCWHQRQQASIWSWGVAGTQKCFLTDSAQRWCVWGSRASSAAGRCVKRLGTIQRGTMGERLARSSGALSGFHFLDISITLNWETLGNTNSCRLCSGSAAQKDNKPWNLKNLCVKGSPHFSHVSLPLLVLLPESGVLLFPVSGLGEEF